MKNKRRKRRNFPKLSRIILLIILVFLVKDKLIPLARGPVKEDSPESRGKEAFDYDLVEEEETKPELSPRSVNLLAVGDAIYHMPQVRGAYKDGNYNFDHNFKYVSDLVSKSDLSIINFETTAMGNDQTFSGYPAFHSPVETLDSIKNAGFDLVNLCNNHSLDRGLDGLVKTLENTRARGFDTIGSSLPGEDKSLVKEVNGMKLGLLSYSYSFNGNEARYSKEEVAEITNLIDEEKIEKDIVAMEDKADFTIVYIHWGNEYESEPNDTQKALADKMFNWGADLVLGSHPHVIQRGEKKEVGGEDKYVVYSLGNFISNQRTETVGKPRTEDGLILSLDLNIDQEGRKTIDNINYTPTWTYRYDLGGRPNYEVIPIEKALNGEIEVHNLEGIRPRLNDSLTRTRTVLGI